MSSINSPCAACKFLRQKCTQECVFAPYFPPDQPQKFANVHRVFGASNISKILKELNPTYREDTVISLAYEADTRLQDPVYGCVGLISILQHRLRLVQQDLVNAKRELANYIRPMIELDPGYSQQPGNGLPYNMQTAFGLPAPEQKQEQNEIVRFINGGFERVTVTGLNATASSLPPELGLSSYHNNTNGFQIQQQTQDGLRHLLFQSQQTQPS